MHDLLGLEVINKFKCRNSCLDGEWIAADENSKLWEIKWLGLLKISSWRQWLWLRWQSRRYRTPEVHSSNPAWHRQSFVMNLFSVICWKEEKDAGNCAHSKSFPWVGHGDTSPSTPTIWVWIPLTSKTFLEQTVFEKNEYKQKRSGMVLWNAPVERLSSWTQTKRVQIRYTVVIILVASNI